MSIEIKVCVGEEYVLNGRAALYLDRAMGALGFARGAGDYDMVPPPADMVLASTAMPEPEQPPQPAAPREVEIESAIRPDAADGDRLYGKPGGGRARRTKAEMAEDARLEAMFPGGVPDAPVADLLAGGTVPSPNISANPENRIDPTSPEDAAQDAEDEAAERPGDDAPTLDTVRRLAAQYATQATMARAVIEIPQILGGPLSAVTDIPAAVAALEKALAGLSGEDTAAPEPEERHATREDLSAALMRLGALLDGKNVPPPEMKKLEAFGGALFKRLFGVPNLSAIPNHPAAYGKALTEVEAKIARVQNDGAQ